jgi:flagellar hook-basal body complex protein FliE
MTEFKVNNAPFLPAGAGIQTPKKKSTGFGEVIGSAVKKVNHLENQADQSVVDLLKGKADVHETMIALQKADISMRLMLSVRNKVLEAYREIMHMQF